MKQTVTIEVDVPDGFEVTGEYRKPVGNVDYWLDRNKGTAKTPKQWTTSNREIILRPTLKPPLCVPENRKWRVEVYVDGNNILNIEDASLSGVGNVAEFRREILTAAEHLVAFIGREPTAWDDVKVKEVNTALGYLFGGES